MLTPGQILQDRYRVEALIAKSGMGAVYRATDIRFGSTVALKEVAVADQRVRDEVHQAFEREARLLNKLRHPSLPVVHDYFETIESGQYLVMQFIEGDDLGELLSRSPKPFDIEEVVKWADDLLDTLEYLHGQVPPVLHRDIKPANLKISASGRVCLLDFGLAKDSKGQSVHGFTREYAPFEQIQGEGTDSRSDLYGLAACLYRLITGKLPPDSLTRAASVMRGSVDPLESSYPPDWAVPIAIKDVLNRALALDPDDRFASASEMRSALTAAAARGVKNRGELLDPADSLTIVRARPRRLFVSLTQDEIGRKAEPSVVASGLQTGSIGAVDRDNTVESRMLLGTQTRGGPNMDKRSRAFVWLRRVLLAVLVMLCSIYGFRVSKIIQGYRAFTRASQLAVLKTDDAKRKAIDEYREALALCRAGGSTIGEADTLRSIGRVHYELGNKTAALDYYNQALLVYRVDRDRRLQAETLENIALVYSDLGDQQKAQSYNLMAKALTSR